MSREKFHNAEDIIFNESYERPKVNPSELQTLKDLRGLIRDISDEELNKERAFRTMTYQTHVELSNDELVQNIKHSEARDLLEVVGRITRNWQYPNKRDIHLKTGDVLENAPGLDSGEMGEVVARLVGQGILEDFPKFEDTAVRVHRPVGVEFDKQNKKVLVKVEFMIENDEDVNLRRNIHATYIFNADLPNIEAAIEKLEPKEENNSQYENMEWLQELA